LAHVDRFGSSAPLRPPHTSCGRCAAVGTCCIGKGGKRRCRCGVLTTSADRNEPRRRPHVSPSPFTLQRVLYTLTALSAVCGRPPPLHPPSLLMFSSRSRCPRLLWLFLPRHAHFVVPLPAPALATRLQCLTTWAIGCWCAPPLATAVLSHSILPPSGILLKDALDCLKAPNPRPGLVPSCSPVSRLPTPGTPRAEWSLLSESGLPSLPCS